MSLLPQNFDDEIASTLKNYRYRRNVDEVESGKERELKMRIAIEKRLNQKRNQGN